jgi:hypothetical protein
MVPRQQSTERLPALIVTNNSPHDVNSLYLRAHLVRGTESIEVECRALIPHGRERGVVARPSEC